MRDPKLHILQHSLGLDDYGRGTEYRNRFVTGPRTVDFPLCEELVAAGLMDVGLAPEWVGGDSVYYVTDAGRQFVRDHSPNPPKLTRSLRVRRGAA